MTRDREARIVSWEVLEVVKEVKEIGKKEEDE